MNENQKAVLVICLGILFVVLLFPPDSSGYQGRLIVEMRKSVDLVKLGVEIGAVIVLAAGGFLLFYNIKPKVLVKSNQPLVKNKPPLVQSKPQAKSAMIQICPYCGDRLKVPEEYIGKRLKCQKCNTPFWTSSQKTMGIPIEQPNKQNHVAPSKTGAPKENT